MTEMTTAGIVFVHKKRGAPVFSRVSKNDTVKEV